MAFLIFLSGCLDNGKTKTEIVSKDMIIIKSIDVFPSTELQPDNTLIIRMEVENVGQESTYLLIDKNSTDSKSLTWNGDYLLIDHCPSLYNANTNKALKDADFQILSGGSCVAVCDAADTNCDNPLIPLVKDSEGNKIGAVRDASGTAVSVSGKTLTACYLKIPPGQSHTFQWSLKAPASDRIADITQKCMFKFQTAYAAKAVTNTYVYFADPIEVAQRMYTKKDMTLVGDNIASYGPVAVNFAPAEPQPIPARTDGKWTVFLNMKNVGEGITDIDVLSILLPENVMTYEENYINYCLMGGTLDKKIINDRLNALEIMLQINNPAIVSDNNPVVQAFTNYFDYCKNINPNNKACTTEKYDFVKTVYDASCIDPEKDLFCLNTVKTMRMTLEDSRSLLQINRDASSRISCELTIPTGVTILSPFRFVTTADYTYYIRKDIQITTKPIKERA